jgi:ABC-type multidrug transport system ATPase subunit
MSEDVLAATALTVGRGRRIVLSDVSLALRSGRAVHLAGANGSGKTSLLRVLAGLVAPRRGKLRRTGTCAFVPERVHLASALRGVEWLRAMRDLRGLAPMDWAAVAPRPASSRPCWSGRARSSARACCSASR